MVIKHSEVEYLPRHLIGYPGWPFTLRDIKALSPACDLWSVLRDKGNQEGGTRRSGSLPQQWINHRSRRKMDEHPAIADDTIHAVEKYLNGSATRSLTAHHLLSGLEGYYGKYPQKLVGELHMSVARPAISPTSSGSRVRLYSGCATTLG
jgi:hypothetical protein